MMTKKAYLRNGDEVVLHGALENGQSIIERMFWYGEDTEPCGIKEIVNEVFMNPPVEKKHDYLIKIIEKTELKRKELAEIEKQLRISKSELSESEKYKTDISKHIIDRSEILSAKRLTVFNGYKPFTLTEENSKRDLRLSYQVDIWEGKFNSWICSLDYDGRPSYSRNINLKYGILIDATDDEILEICKQIVKDKENVSNYDLRRRDLLPDEYLTEELMQKRVDLLAKEKLENIKNQEENIKKEQEKLRKLIEEKQHE